MLGYSRLYAKPTNAILDHVPKISRNFFKSFKTITLKQGNSNYRSKTILIDAPGLYRLIFGSKLEIAEKFQNWVCSDVLPSIRKYGYYKLFDNPQILTFKIENEYDLHVKVIDYNKIRKFYPEAVITTGLGELQDTGAKRIAAYEKV